MVNFSFYDDNGTVLRAIDGSDDIPDQAVRIEVSGPFDSNTSNYKLLTTILWHSTKKFDQIKVARLSAEESPEFLALFVLICNNCSSLDFKECSLTTNAMSCLMSALFTRDAIRCLSMGVMTVETDQIKILLQGIASSPCLERLDLGIAFADEHDAVLGKCLIEAVQRNQSLKSLFLFTSTISRSDPDFLPNLVQASISAPNIKSLSIEDGGRTFIDGGRALQLGILQDALCRKDCNIEKLSLEEIRIQTGEAWHGSIIQNVSVKSLSIRSTHASNDGISKILSLFKSLEELNISGNNIKKLSFLDPLLLGEKSQLKSLEVCYNSIAQEEMELFIEKLRNVRGLKNLAIDSIDWEDYESILDKVSDVFRNNTDLEHCDFCREDLPLNLNQGGRRIFESSTPFPTKLLPRVLERASKLTYYNQGRGDRQADDWGSPTDKQARVDVVYWMIQRLAPQL